MCTEGHPREDTGRRWPGGQESGLRGNLSGPLLDLRLAASRTGTECMVYG